jgi:WD40 repeat protein
VIFSPDGSLVAFATEAAVVLWDWKAGTTRQVLKVDGVVTAMSFSTSGKLLAAASADPDRFRGATIRILDLETNQIRTEWHGGERGVLRLAFSPDNRRLATAGISATHQWLLRLWDTESGRETFSAALPPVTITALAFSPDGYRLAAATQAEDAFAVRTSSQPAEIYVWDATPADTGRP